MKGVKVAVVDTGPGSHISLEIEIFESPELMCNWRNNNGLKCSDFNSERREPQLVFELET